MQSSSAIGLSKIGNLQNAIQIMNISNNKAGAFFACQIGAVSLGENPLDTNWTVAAPAMQGVPRDGPVFLFESCHVLSEGLVMECLSDRLLRLPTSILVWKLNNLTLEAQRLVLKMQKEL